MCTVGGHLLHVYFFFGKALSKLQVESIFQLTIARIMDRSDIDQRKESRLRRRQESERRHRSEETAEQREQTQIDTM